MSLAVLCSSKRSCLRREQARIECARITTFQSSSTFCGFQASLALGTVIRPCHSLRPSFKLLEFQKEDLLLCCSDGVWEFLSDADAISTVLQARRERVHASASPGKRVDKSSMQREPVEIRSLHIHGGWAQKPCRCCSETCR